MPMRPSLGGVLACTRQACRPPSALLPRTSKRGVKLGWSTAARHDAKFRRFNQPEARGGSGLPVLTTGPAAACKRREQSTPLRTGVLAIKRGMVGFLTRKGTRFPCTVLQLDRVQVVANRTREKNGYWGVQVGLGAKRPATATAPVLGYFEAKGMAVKEHLSEFRVRNKEGLLPVGVELKPDWFHKGQWVDVRSNSKGKGFAGVMKRHGFKGQGASHGNSLHHRALGSASPSQGSGARVLPGKKMPGRMGNIRVTVQNLPVLQIDNELGIVVVKGCVAGPKGTVVKISDAIKKPPPAEDFIEQTKGLLLERFPGVLDLVQQAREKHLELKQARQQGRIDELVTVPA